MRHPRVLALTVTFGLLATASLAAEHGDRHRLPRLIDRVAKDPVLVTVMQIGSLDDMLDGWLELLGTVAGQEVDPAEMEAGLAELDGKLGCSLRNDLLARVGPEVAFVLDLPPIDSLMAGAANPAALPAMLNGVGITARVREGSKLDACLRNLLTLGDSGEVVEEDGLVRVEYPIPDAPPDSALSLIYGIRDDVLALGVARSFVSGSLAPRPKGERLADGADFQRVFGHLDRDAESLSYVNLPKVREMVRSSAMLQSIAANDEEVKPLMNLLLDPALTATGAGSTSRDVEGGTRTTSFGPSLFRGGTATTGIIAAIAVPNFLNAVDRGKQKRSMAEIRSIATVCEAFAVDNGPYPGPTDGWVDVATIAEQVSPAYIRTLPQVDGWGHPIRFWSSGESYRIVSPGKDGVVDGDWSGELEGGPSANFNDDIVFADGQFVQWPEGEQE